jgi:uncharacterized protein YaiI (UPF0178 family)
VITTDTPLVAEAVEKEFYALNPRGEFYTADNIKSRLNIRDFMDALRESVLIQVARQHLVRVSGKPLLTILISF